MAVDIEMTEKRSDLRFAHLPGMTFAVKKNKPADPIDVSAFGANAVAFDAEMPFDAIEKFRLLDDARFLGNAKRGSCRPWSGAAEGRDAHRLLILSIRERDGKHQFPSAIHKSTKP